MPILQVRKLRLKEVRYLSSSHMAGKWWMQDMSQNCSDFFLISLFIYGCVESSFLCEGFLQLWQAGATSSRCAGLSLSRPLLLRSTGSRRAGSVVVPHGLSCSAACGIFPDQGSNPCPLHWQADSQPLHHQGSPRTVLILKPVFLTTLLHYLEKVVGKFHLDEKTVSL